MSFDDFRQSANPPIRQLAQKKGKRFYRRNLRF
jgi:hypothetical protein